MNTNFKKTFLLVCSLVVLFAGTANAQLEDGEGLNSQILWTTPGPSNFAFVQSADVLANKDVSLSAVGQYYRKPLGLEIGDTVFWSVKRVNVVDFSWAVGLLDRIQLGMVLPVVVEQYGKGAAPLSDSDDTDGKSEIASAAIGDLRFHAKTQFYKQNDCVENRGAGVALDIGLSVPSGDEENFTGEKGIVFAPSLILDFRRTFLSAGTNIGVRLRSGDKAVLADSDVGNQLTYGLATTFHLFDEKLLIGGESTLLAEIDNFNRMGLELRGSIGTKPGASKAVALWLTGSAGIANRDEPLLSVPQMRFTLGLTYTPSFDDAADDALY
ncbi:MAG: hypothetical protein JXX29_00815 [Deltaproteobacteria bacterium]|nr:hypothetical protein [Deltaproteobacteria bacterium]MBN2670179.1 hypothetical protein [Deltaproteobacteria bacterium]